MALLRGNGNDFDAIDLTLSSPEPESPPRTKEQVRAPPRQPQPYSRWPHSAPHVKQEPYHFPRVKGENGHLPRIRPEPGQPSRVQKNSSPLATSSRAPGSPQETRQIHPNHLHAILATTNPQDLQRVLLELCQLSPALSGALVRGLAPYSITARSMINQHGRHTIREPIPLKDNERRLPWDTSYKPQGNRLPWYRRPEDQTSQARQHTHTFQSTPQVEREPYRPSTPDDWRSFSGRPSTPSPDRELRRPGPSAQKMARPNVNRTPSQNLPKSSSTINRSSDTDTAIQKMAGIQKATSNAASTCVKCHEPFSDVFQPCIYHPGEKIKQEDGMIVWSCCYEDMLSVGCDFGGNHTAERNL